jgi:hypothetical protein
MPEPGPAIVYRFYNGQGVLLYVGITQNFGQRMAGHMRESAWWGQVSWMTLDILPSWGAAWRAEGVAIFRERPAYNDNRNPRRRHLTEKHQAPHPGRYDA